MSTAEIKTPHVVSEGPLYHMKACKVNTFFKRYILATIKVQKQYRREGEILFVCKITLT